MVTGDIYAQYNILRLSFIKQVRMCPSQHCEGLKYLEITELLQGWYQESGREFTGSYWALKGHPASSQEDHRDQVHSDQMVLAMIRRGRLFRQSIAQQRPRVSKLEAKGLSGCHPSGQQPRQPDGKARGQIKDYSHDNLQKNTELKAALTGSTVRQKAKEERRLLYAPILKLREGMVLQSMKMQMSENQNSQSQVHVTALWYLRFKPGNRGLNRPFTFMRGGGGSHTLPNHVTEMDGQHNTREGSSC